jgi:hypothetical protein
MVPKRAFYLGASIVLLLALSSLPFLPARAQQDDKEEQRLKRIDPRDSVFKGKAVDIAAGEIPAAEFFRFLADHTGLPVIVDSTRALEKSIYTAAPIKDANEEIVVGLLRANRIHVERTKLPSGKEVLMVGLPEDSKLNVDARLHDLEQRLEALLVDVRNLRTAIQGDSLKTK